MSESGEQALTVAQLILERPIEDVAYKSPELQRHEIACLVQKALNQQAAEIERLKAERDSAQEMYEKEVEYSSQCNAVVEAARAWLEQNYRCHHGTTDNCVCSWCVLQAAVRALDAKEADDE